MRLTIRHLGIPVGVVNLAPTELVSAGTMEVRDGYAAIRSTVREGSVALLQWGFYGPALRASTMEDEQAVLALNTAAQLVFEFADVNGNDVPATFINLIEPPNDDRVVVVARLNHAYSRSTADNMLQNRQDGAASPFSPLDDARG